MDVFLLIGITIGTLIGAGFNYLLNRAPGSDPDDFQIGPPEMNITCDCFLNPLIVGGIAVLILAISAGAFTNRDELFIVGIFVFAIITIAGLIGRRHRYREWNELRRVFDRAIPKSKIRRPLDNHPDVFFDVGDIDDEEDD